MADIIPVGGGMGSNAARLAGLAACAAGLLGLGAAQTHGGQIESAYFQGKLVEFRVTPAEPGQRALDIGPWKFGARVPNPRPSDRRLNLYLVAPGSQHHAPGWEEYDHNDIINDIPNGGQAVEWDVYWAVVLDPRLRRDFRSERDLLVAAQAGFTPGDLFDLEDVPGEVFLREFLKIESLAGLEQHRRKDGRFPRVLIVPAGFAVRASAREPQEPAAGSSEN